MKMYPFKNIGIGVALLVAGGVGFVLGSMYGTAAGQVDTREPFPSIYTDQGFGFSFRYPQGFTVFGPFDDEYDDTKTTWLAQKDGVDAFELTHTKYEEEGPITLEQVRQDNPGHTIENAETFSIDSRGAVGFSSQDESGAPLYMVVTADDWFMYHFTAPASFRDTLLDILKTWKFPPA